MSEDTNDASGGDQAPFNWCDHLPVHPLAEAYPKVPHDRLVEIGEDIRKRGLEFPIFINAKGDPANPAAFELFDGVTRLNAMVAVGIKFEFKRFRIALGGAHSLRLVIHDIEDDSGERTTKIFHNLDDAEIAAKIESANLHRRHLEPEQYHARLQASHARIEAAIKVNPEKSDRQLGKELGVDHKTVGGVRLKMELTGEISPVGKTVGADGKARRKAARKAPKPGSGCSPGFDAARKRAERLGREVEQLKSGGFRLTSPDGAPPVCFHSLKRLNQALKDVESEAGAKAEEKAPVEADDSETSAEEQQVDYGPTVGETFGSVEACDSAGYGYVALLAAARNIEGRDACAVAKWAHFSEEHELPQFRAALDRVLEFVAAVKAALDGSSPPPLSDGPDGDAADAEPDPAEQPITPPIPPATATGTDDLAIPPFLLRTPPIVDAGAIEQPATKVAR